MLISSSAGEFRVRGLLKRETNEKKGGEIILAHQ